MKRTHQSFLIAGLVGLASSLVSAAPITFIHDGSGNGTLDGVAFSAVFTITATGNTDDRNDLGGAWDIEHTSATINIDGVGSFDFISPTRTFVNNGGQLVGFSRTVGAGGNDLFNGPNNAAFGTWDMTTSIGPIGGGGDLIQWGDPNPAVVTTGGVLYFDNFFTDAQFTAIVVPAPATLLALGGLVATRRRRAAV